MLQVFINGPPGAGKTTLCKLLCAELRLEQLSTGDLLKDNIAQRTELGRIAKQCIASKALVPDHVVVDMVAEKVLECSLRGQGWVLDGFPRTVEQCAALRRKMISPSVVIVLELSERACTQRITGRRFDNATGVIYHLPTLPPHDASVLARLTKRGDDTSDKLPPRFEAYRSYGEKTNAVFSSIAHRIDASAKTPEELLEDVLALLHSIRPTGGSGSITGDAFHGSAGNSNVGRTLQDNQQHVGTPQRATPPAPVSGALSKQLKKQIAPQRIDEVEHEEDEVSVDMQEINYDCDDDDVVSVSSSAQQLGEQQQKKKTAELEPESPAESSKPTSLTKQTPESSRNSSASSSGNNNEELPSATTSVASAGSSSATIAAPAVVNGVDMNTFRDLLLDGFEVLKHGRRGSPHMRLVFTDMDFKRIFWQKVAKGSSAKKPKLDQSLVLADVMQVVRGMKTEVLKRSGDVSKYERYLSLVADDRTLDMEFASDAACDLFLRGFDVLLHGSH
ncbi:hypothetical protein PybrP1_007310 [[Pythium] brassicae (nom. inval.)]|nr:hypothetical protein PybrP1_007310 [[Pythium] brassicae (nom. inval.)]